MPAVAEHHEHLDGTRLSRWVAGAVCYRLTGFPAAVQVGMPSGSVTLVVRIDASLTVAEDWRALAGLRGLGRPDLGVRGGGCHGLRGDRRPGRRLGAC